MIKALRICMSSSNPYENISILDADDQKHEGVPNFFEDAQIAFKSKDGLFVLPDYKITMIQFKKHGKKPIGTSIKRILISDDLNFADCIHISPEQYANHGIPQIFRGDEQFVFWCKTDGFIIVPDFQVIYVRLR